MINEWLYTGSGSDARNKDKCDSSAVRQMVKYTMHHQHESSVAAHALELDLSWTWVSVVDGESLSLSQPCNLLCQGLKNYASLAR